MGTRSQPLVKDELDNLRGCLAVARYPKRVEARIAETIGKAETQFRLTTLVESLLVEAFSETTGNWALLSNVRVIAAPEVIIPYVLLSRTGVAILVYIDVPPQSLTAPDERIHDYLMEGGDPKATLATAEHAFSRWCSANLDYPVSVRTIVIGNEGPTPRSYGADIETCSVAEALEKILDLNLELAHKRVIVKPLVISVEKLEAAKHQLLQLSAPSPHPILHTISRQLPTEVA